MDSAYTRRSPPVTQVRGSSAAHFGWIALTAFGLEARRRRLALEMTLEMLGEKAGLTAI